MSYQGHSADGSSIQNHSIGNIYPFVIQIREIANGHGGWNRTYELLHPSGSLTSHSTNQEAIEVATKAIIAKQVADSQAGAQKMIAILLPLVSIGLIDVGKASSLVTAQVAKQHGLPISRNEQREYDVAVGHANLLKTFQSRSAREDLIFG
ncbi:hypothetical protein [Polynucleobacter sp. UK-Kesae-W10]|uniref:hypothetical protein n=1 Tax=Polynucleobacter sp. UK-Kesae-W10 TaxID=1819738 RepID=UPI001C0CCBEE|nr:hypothetical protein [Polynucleobacter sp. UK-Kesae-W10]MBU3577543.1 hypothetical protein [Polynucleobacter sp. UK-Kesae-W10]